MTWQGKALKLVYFDIRGRAEYIRVALHHGGFEFEDVRLTREEFLQQKEKGEFPFGQLPVLYIGDEVISQSHSIARFVAKLAGLYPEDPLVALRCDEILDAIIDFIGCLRPSFVENDPEKKMALRRVLAEEEFPRWFKRFERKLETAGGTYFGGKEITIADLAFYYLLHWLTSGILDGIPVTVLDPFPLLVAFKNRVESHPIVVKYYEELESASSSNTSN